MILKCKPTEERGISAHYHYAPVDDIRQHGAGPNGIMLGVYEKGSGACTDSRITVSLEVQDGKPVLLINEDVAEELGIRIVMTDKNWNPKEPVTSVQESRDDLLRFGVRRPCCMDCENCHSTEFRRCLGGKISSGRGFCEESGDDVGLYSRACDSFEPYVDCEIEQLAYENEPVWTFGMNLILEEDDPDFPGLIEYLRANDNDFRKLEEAVTAVCKQTGVTYDVSKWSIRRRNHGKNNYHKR